MELAGNWNYPTSIRFGAGRIAELGACCRELGMSRPLLVTDAGLARLAIVDDARQRCESDGIPCVMYANVAGNPTGAQVAQGVAAFRAGEHDGVIAFGGGSALDAGKAIAFMSAQTRPLWDFEDVGDNWLRASTEGLPPVVAVPTTSGTGSEVGRASVITDPEQVAKKIVFHPRMLPEIALSDPALTVSLPQRITAATGMDALSHSMEAFFAPAYHPLARGVAIEGMRLVKAWLPRAVREGGDLEARAHMLAASQAGATAFQKGLGGMHALAHSLGALYDAHHGTLNAVLMPFVLEENRAAIEADAADLARCLDLEPSFDALLAWVLALRDEIGIPETLAGIGLDASEPERVGAMAAVDPAAAGNPTPLDAAQYARLFERAVRG
jgi:alcohol dehydrogenase class IV